jgi:hypothetical protein
MKLYELLALERRLSNLTYDFNIIEINRMHSLFHEWSDIPFPQIDKISLYGHNVFQSVHGPSCSWLKVYLVVDSLIENLKNPNENYLEAFRIKDSELIVALAS